MLTETPANHPIAPTAGAAGAPEKKPGAATTQAGTQPATLTGRAEHAEYHAADQVLHLSGGNPRITDSTTMQVAADLIDYHRDTQNAVASGNVKATYTQQQQKSGTAAQNAPPAVGFGGGNGPVHVVAERATMDHATNQDVFYGAGNGLGAGHAPARMWQDADSLLAPVIAIDRNQNLLKAWGEGTGTAPVVNANFASAMGAKHQQNVVRVHSQTLVYSDKTRQADFRGTVTAEQGDEAIHADDAVMFLKPAAGNGKDAHPENGPARQHRACRWFRATGSPDRYGPCGVYAAGPQGRRREAGVHGGRWEVRSDGDRGGVAEDVGSRARHDDGGGADLQQSG
jgi:lipopolysaccharide export system protein LptA